MQKPLTPRTKIDSQGKMRYNESFQAWNTVNLKKEVFLEFPQLKDKRSKFSYRLTYCRNLEELEKEIKGCSNAGIPLLLWLFKEA